jgi:NitT/TauT family transport system permease protein
MPGLVLALVHLFPKSNLGLEIAAIVMIFTGQGWNLVFSFYSSVKAVPQEIREVSKLYKLNPWQVFKSVELPYSLNGLLWNSMLSMAGGWFFLMTIESFTLGDKDFRLPGIGSYMAVAYAENNVMAIFAGIIAMFVLIILVDRCLWAPLVVWSEKFKLDRDPSQLASHSFILDWIRQSRIMQSYFKYTRKMNKTFTEQAKNISKATPHVPSKWTKVLIPFFRTLVSIFGLVICLYGLKKIFELTAGSDLALWILYVKNTFYTFLRVMIAVILGSFWAIPLGVFIGINPKWTSRLQPVVQVVASFPAPMLFPILMILLNKLHISMEFSAVILMLFASQWYILFNVISGATQIPKQMLEVAQIFKVSGLQYWKSIIIPAIFPSLVNGWITAAGGAWNACIVSEFLQMEGKTYTATGIGASISQAALDGNFSILAGSILIMVTTVVLLNRLFWNNLYRLAETRFKLEY